MTCIVGYVHKDSLGRRSVYIGGDSAGVGGWEITVRKDNKVFHNGEFLIGFTTSFRMGQIVQYNFNPPQIPDGMEIHKYMCTLFIDELRRCLHEKGFAKKQENQESGGSFLVGVRGRLFDVGNDFQVGESCAGYDAVGCGAAPAIGALYVATRTMTNPNLIVKTALDAAAHNNMGVCGPMLIMSQLPTE